MINTNIDSWGLEPDAKNDVARFDVPVIKTNNSLEYFTIVFEKKGTTAELLMAWDNAEVRLAHAFLSPILSALPEIILDIYSMCGIAGIIQANISTYNKEQLAKMTGALAHRGPLTEKACGKMKPAMSYWGTSSISIIDLSDSGQQPMHYQDRYTIIHNGEIYNYIELKESTKKGYAFHSQTDTEVITAAYDCWKDDCVNHFDGMFAFAIWDEKNRNHLQQETVFKEGKNHFFYFFNGPDFLFASEMKALWAAGVAKIPNQKMLFNFITIGYVDNPARPEENFLQNIYKLPPACRLKFSGIYLNYSVVQYWDIDLTAKQKNSSDADAIEQFIHLFSRNLLKKDYGAMCL